MSSVRSSPERDLGRCRARRSRSRSRRGRARRASPACASARRCSPACCAPTAGFWPITKRPSSAAVERAQHRREVRVVAGDLRQALEAVVVLRRGGVAEPGLQQRDDVLGEVRPPAALGAAAVDVGRRGRSSPSRAVRHRQVAGQQVVERRDVGRALDRGVAAQRQDAAAGPARCCRAAAAGSRRRGSSARRRCAASSRPRSRTRWCARGPSCAISVSATAQEVARARCRRRCSTISGV